MQNIRELHIAIADPCISIGQKCNWRPKYADHIETGAACRRSHHHDGSGALNLTGDGAAF
jgi:hypothetical protein